VSGKGQSIDETWLEPLACPFFAKQSEEDELRCTLSLTLIVCLLPASAVAHETTTEPIDAEIPMRGAGNRDPRLRIDSPRDGAVVVPGETLQVTVSSPNRTRFVAIGVAMEDPIDTSDQEATSLPARFAIKIPKGIALGSYTVSAMAGLAGRVGGEWVVAVIDVDIERREMPRAISSRNYPAGFSLLLEKKGETRDIERLGDFGNGDVVLVTESSRVGFESSDTAVATVDKSGTITAVGVGHAAVVAWYGPRDKGIKASIPVEVR